MADIILNKSQIVSEDLQIGLGKVQQKRGSETVELTELNASELLGIIVIDTVEQLEVLEPDRMKVRAVFVQATKCIYTWNGTEWTTSYNNIYVIDSMTNKASIPSGYSIVFSIAENKLYYKAGSQWLANGNYIYVTASEQEARLLPTGAKMALTMDSGTLLVQQAGAWNRIQLDVNGDPILVVDEIDELPKVVNNIKTCIVKDRKRGGIFVYEKAYSGTNDGGIIINGWRRQYEGSVSVLWFGADNNGNVDSTLAFSQAFKHINVIIPAGTYLIKQLVLCDSDLDLQGFGAKIKLQDSGSLQFGIEDPQETWAQISTVAGGTNAFDLIDVQLYEYGKYGRFRSNTTFSNYTEVMNSQISKLVSLDGLTCYIGDFFKSTMERAQIKVIKPYRVNIRGLTIESTSDNTAVRMINVCDSVLDNIYINSFYSDCMLFKDCANLKFNNAVISVDNMGTFTGLVVDGCDNLILDSIIIRGSKAGIEFINTPSNIIGIYRGVISGVNSIDNKGLTYSLNCFDTQLLGNLIIGGINLALNNCTLIMPYVWMRFFAGGSVELTNCTCLGTSTGIKYNFIRVSDNLTMKDGLKLSVPTHYTIKDCTFQGTQAYTGMGFIECIAAQRKNNVEGTELVGNIQIDNFVSTIDLATIAYIYGLFNNVSITNITCSAQPTAVDVQQLYTTNIKILAEYNPAICVVNNFYTDLTHYLTIVKEPTETEGSIIRDYTTASGFVLDATIPIHYAEVIPPARCWVTDFENKRRVEKLWNNDKVKFRMKSSCTIKSK